MPTSISGPALDVSKTNEAFWPSVAEILVGSTRVIVHYNIPTIMSLVPPTEVQVGVPAAVSEVRVLFSSASDVEYEWAVLPSPAAGKSTERIVCRRPLYVPAPEDLNMAVVVRCRPAGPNTPWTECAVGIVTAPRPPMPRWKHLTGLPAPPPTFRVVTYNILHQDFCSTKYAKTRLYPFASEEVLSQTFRQGRVAEELLKYRGDLLCLQEVGKDSYDRYYMPILQQIGYEGVLAVKCGKSREGCATLFNTNRFELLSAPLTIPLTMETLTLQHPDLAAEIHRNHKHFAEALSRVISVALVMVLRDKATGHVIIASNTHLFFHANGCHIRSLQAYMLLSRLASLERELVGRDGHKSVSVVAAGDFNFTSITGGYKLMTQGGLDGGNDCWEKGSKFWWGCDKLLGLDGLQEELEEAQTDLTTAEAPRDASGASGLQATQQPPPSPPPAGASTIPADLVAFRPAAPLTVPLSLHDTHVGCSTLCYSHYAIAFKAVIDHVFASANLKVVSTLPAPSEQELSADVALPSRMYPSDHVALVVDLTVAA